MVLHFPADDKIVECLGKKRVTTGRLTIPFRGKIYERPALLCQWRSGGAVAQFTFLWVSSLKSLFLNHYDFVAATLRIFPSTFFILLWSNNPTVVL